MAFKIILKNGAGNDLINEPHHTTSYLSVYTTHFINSPTENHGILRKLYIEKELTIAEISKITEWHSSSIKRGLQKHKIFKELTIKQNIYGWRKNGLQVVPHKGEQKIIKEIIALRKEGQTSQYIATHLNSRNIPTKNNNLWMRNTVIQVVKNNIQSI